MIKSIAIQNMSIKRIVMSLIWTIASTPIEFKKQAHQLHQMYSVAIIRRVVCP